MAPKRAPGRREMAKNKQGDGNFRAGRREMKKNEQGEGRWASSRENCFSHKFLTLNCTFLKFFLQNIRYG